MALRAFTFSKQGRKHQKELKCQKMKVLKMSKSADLKCQKMKVLKMSKSAETSENEMLLEC